MPTQYGIIGYPLSHTFSPAYFNSKFAEAGINAVYNTYPLLQINDIKELLDAVPLLRGLNVTMPYKQSIISYLDSVDSVVGDMGAVNCIDFRNGVTKGYNTDVIGFRDSLTPLLQSHHKQALILGTGGASRAVGYVLGNLGINYKKVSRTIAPNVITYAELTPEIMKEYTLIINTTPMGMAPDIATYPPLPYKGITPHHLLYDLVYNPVETRFLTLGKQRGAIVKNGLEMLPLQAEAAWQIWVT
jgi:shikimate dehydrogenase